MRKKFFLKNLIFRNKDNFHNEFVRKKLKFCESNVNEFRELELLFNVLNEDFGAMISYIFKIRPESAINKLLR